MVLTYTAPRVLCIAMAQADNSSMLTKLYEYFSKEEVCGWCAGHLRGVSMSINRVLPLLQFLTPFLGEMVMAPQRTEGAAAMDHILSEHANSMSATQVRAR